MGFRQYMENLSTDYYYHITYAKNLASIGWNGLRRNARPNWKWVYAEHSRTGVFVTTAKLIPYWIERFENLAEANSDDLIKDKLIPIILRFTLYERKLTPDTMANAEDKVYKSPGIPPNRIEMWTGRVWQKKLTLTTLKLSDFLWKNEHGVYFHERYPFPPV